MAKGYVCPECGLDYDTVSPKDAVVAARSFPRRFRELLADVDDKVLRTRPAPATWSALEYTAHLADTLDWMADTVHAMVIEDEPTIPFYDPDEEAESRHYNDQDVAAVLDHLDAAANRFADVLDRVSPDDWGRTAIFPWGERDALMMARNGIHEGVHHLRDAERGLAKVS